MKVLKEKKMLLYKEGCWLLIMLCLSLYVRAHRPIEVQ